jgi:hypothetical protein
MMIVKLLAGCVLLFQSGAVLVSDNNNLAYALQTLKNLEFVWRYACSYLQFPNVKPTQDCSAPAPANLFLSNLLHIQ